MQITRNTTETATGPAEWFTGTVYIDTVATASEPSRLGAASVHFTPARGPRGTPTPSGRPSTSQRAWGSASAGAERSR
jgi:hypothetical protein